MTPRELSDAIRKGREREQRAAIAVVEFARNVLFTLRDHGAASVADELSRLIHVYDCEVEQSHKLTADNMDSFLVLIKQHLGQGDLP